ncbi:NAD(P)-dependent oxidoreductase [Opitutales bacterium]|nr:NAD(P)-dependent oxidoreductase [Opitutales bacterium]
MNMEKVNGRKITLIGGAGFIGHNLALHLHSLGAQVSIIDSLQVNNLASFSATAVDSVNHALYLRILNERQRLLQEAQIPLFVQDARNYHALCRLIADIQPQVVVQLAAVSHANKSNKDPYSTFDHSFRTLENALDASRDTVEHFIYFSSSMVYGHFTEAAVTEESTCNPLGIYGALKYGGEKLVIAYNQVFDLPYTIVRPSALYGERCVSRRVGQIFIENALTGKDINIAGDGSDRLDFTYIKDLVKGIELIISKDESLNQIFNLTYGDSRSLTDMAEIMKANFKNLEVNYMPKDNLTPDRGTLSIEKARSLLDFRPEFPLEKGYIDYINWYKEFHSETRS